MEPLDKILESSQAHVVYGAQDVPVIRFKCFEDIPWLAHGFSTREGGVSEGIYKSMNLSFTRGDDPGAVRENFRRFGRAVDMDWKKMVFARQTHTVNVLPVGRKDWGKGIIKDTDYQDIDGLITNEPDVSLVTFFADCVPLFLVDKNKKVIGASHSGWRGTVARMGAATVAAMREHYGCDPQNLVGVIGPSICGDCYEVSEDVAMAFKDAFGARPWEVFCRPKGGGKYLLDLWKANERVLSEAGIPREQIHVSGLCTHCHPDILWSHRSLGTARGSLAGFMMIREEGALG